MFNFLAEEPITSNEMLYENRNRERITALDQSAGRHLNRYCFLQRKHEKDALSRLFVEVARQVGSHVILVDAWSLHINPVSTVKSKIIAKKYTKIGWSVFHIGETVVAYKSFEFEEVGSWAPMGVRANFYPPIALVTGGPVNDAMSKLDEYCLAEYAQFDFRPTSSLLDQLQFGSVSLIYHITDHVGYNGLVLVTPDRIDASALKSLRDAQKFASDMAYAWFCSY